LIAADSRSAVSEIATLESAALGIEMADRGRRRRVAGQCWLEP